MMPDDIDYALDHAGSTRSTVVDPNLPTGSCHLSCSRPGGSHGLSVARAHSRPRDTSPA